MITGTLCELYGMPAESRDAYGAPAGEPELYSTFDNVLVTPVGSEGGASAIYELSFPKSADIGDLDAALNEGFIRLPRFTGDIDYDLVSEPYKYIEANVPLFWNMKVKAAAISDRKYNRLIRIYRRDMRKDAQGFPVQTETLVREEWASVKTTRGMTLIENNSDFEKAFTNFTIRYPSVEIDRKMIIRYKGKTYTIEYLNNVDEKDVELEIQAKEVTH